ncbi:MAG: hypothetical protein MR488_04650 [Lachnospiraceae bacterium]|nr:hypothetical protein [Lachnospiraceae bacterium]
MSDKTSDKRYRITLTENQLALVETAVGMHELGDPKLVERIRKLSKPDFIKMCEEEDID